MTSIDLINIFSKQWANINDIKKIANCGRDKAIDIRNTITEDIKKEGKILPISKEKIVPMERVIDYLNINIDYIYNMAKKEKQLQL